MNERLRIIEKVEEEVAREKGLNAETLRRMVAKVEECGESLPYELLNILKEELHGKGI